MTEKPIFIYARGKPLPPYTHTIYPNGVERIIPGTWDQSTWIIWKQSRGTLVPVREVKSRHDAERVTASLNGGKAS